MTPRGVLPAKGKPMVRPEEIFLDIETNWDREITVVGFSSRMTGLVQLVGAEITRRRLLKELPRKGHLYTYNGHSFDCVCIRHQLGIDLRESFDSRDLRWICQRLGMMGGQKAIEDHIGVKRALANMDGRDAIRLWQQYRRGKQDALETLLSYNAEDVAGLTAIKKHLEGRGWL